MRIYVVRTHTDNEIVTTDKNKALSQFKEYRFFEVWENDECIQYVSYENKNRALTCPWCDKHKDIDVEQCSECEEMENSQ